MAALKSLPPRPRVVSVPSGVAPMKPVMTGARPLSNTGSKPLAMRASVSCQSGSAFWKKLSVTMNSLESNCSAGKPLACITAAMTRLLRRSP